MAGYNLKDEEEVKEYLKNLHIEYQFGCLSEKRPEVCHLLGDYNEAIKVDYNEAEKIYKKNCDENNFGRSCTKYGEYVASGRSPEINFLKAYKYMKKGCENNDKKGCFDAGAIALSKHEVESSREHQVTGGMKMLNEACEGNIYQACSLLSAIYTMGIEGHVEKSMKDAYRCSFKSCEAENPYACLYLAKLHKLGDGVPKSKELEKFYRKKANTLLKELRQGKAQVQFQQGIEL